MKSIMYHPIITVFKNLLNISEIDTLVWPLVLTNFLVFTFNISFWKFLWLNLLQQTFHRSLRQLNIARDIKILLPASVALNILLQKCFTWVWLLWKQMKPLVITQILQQPPNNLKRMIYGTCEYSPSHKLLFHIKFGWKLGHYFQQGHLSFPCCSKSPRLCINARLLPQEFQIWCLLQDLYWWQYWVNSDNRMIYTCCLIQLKDSGHLLSRINKNSHILL